MLSFALALGFDAVVTILLVAWLLVDGTIPFQGNERFVALGIVVAGLCCAACLVLLYRSRIWFFQRAARVQRQFAAAALISVLAAHALLGALFIAGM